MVEFSPELREVLKRLGAMAKDMRALVSFAFIQFVSSIDAHLSVRIDAVLKNGVKHAAIVGDSFAKKLKMAYGLGLINKSHYDAVLCVNKVRNNIAHDIGFCPALIDLDPIQGCVTVRPMRSLNLS